MVWTHGGETGRTIGPSASDLSGHHGPPSTGRTIGPVAAASDLSGHHGPPSSCRTTGSPDLTGGPPLCGRTTGPSDLFGLTLGETGPITRSPDLNGRSPPLCGRTTGPSGGPTTISTSRLARSRARNIATCSAVGVRRHSLPVLLRIVRAPTNRDSGRAPYHGPPIILPLCLGKRLRPLQPLVYRWRSSLCSPPDGR